MANETYTLIRAITVFILLFLLVMFVYGVVVASFSSTPNLTIWEHESFSLKDKIAEEKSSPKILIGGGSNALFGISAEQIEKELEFPTLNYAIHAGLADYSLERIKNVINPGDTIILALEYEQYWYEEKFLLEKQTIKEQYILTHDQAYFNSLSVFDKLNILSVGAEDLLLNIRSHSRLPREQYDASTLNEWGDETINTVPASMQIEFTPFLVEFPEEFRENFVEYDGVLKIIEFSRWAEENDVAIFATFPSTVYFEEYNGLEYKKNFRLIEVFYEKLGIKTLAEPSDFLYSQDLFYDTRYHLNDRGRYQRTRKILHEIEPYLVKS